MAHPLDLTFSDFQDIVNYCRNSRWSEFIEEHIDSKLKRYYGSNPKMITYILTQIERECDEGKIKLDSEYDCEGEYAPDDVCFYEEGYYKSSNPEILWLHDYLNFLLLHPEIVDDITTSDSNTETKINSSDIILKENNNIGAGSQNKNKISYVIKEKYKLDIITILRKIDANTELSEDINFIDNFVSFLTSQNVTVSSPKPIFNIQCPTNLFVYIIDQLKKNFKARFKDLLFTKYCTIYTKDGDVLSFHNIHATRSRNKLKNKSEIFEKVDKIFQEFTPAIL